jgi:hypothetical protein
MNVHAEIALVVVIVQLGVVVVVAAAAAAAVKVERSTFKDEGEMFWLIWIQLIQLVIKI